MKREIIDGNTAVAKASYKLSEISFIYPITPSSPMAENCDELRAKGELNIFGNKMEITEMQSEAGAIGAVHGSALSGTLSTTFTSSQGLLLMIPNMFKIAGEMLPVVINVASRSVATHSLNIFCDHSDVYSTRQTGFAMLCSSNPQESYFFAVASFLASLKAQIPFLHFFDGFRTSHQISTINTLDDDELKQIYPFDALKKYKARSLTPNNPMQYGTSENGDIYFQGREKSNLQYQKLPSVLNDVFKDIYKVSGYKYSIMEYFGNKNAKFVIVAMASACDTIKNYIMANKSSEIGLVKINLYRPFDKDYFIKILPKTTQKIAVLDRTKEQGSIGEPLYLDVCATILEANKNIKVVGGRFGLGGKEFNPAMVDAVFANLKSKNSKNHFTIGIDDDLSKTSLKYNKNYQIEVKTAKNFVFFGIGSDGTVGASKTITKIIGNENLYVQNYCMYDSKKSGGLTRCFVSASKKPIDAPYLSTQNDIVICNNPSYLAKYNVTSTLKKDGILLVNSKFKNTEQFDNYVLDETKLDIAKKGIKIYSIDANKIAVDNGIRGKISIVMQMAFFKLSNIINYNTARQKSEAFIKTNFAKKGEDVIKQNINAINDVENKIIEIKLDKNWAKLQKTAKIMQKNSYFDKYLAPILNLQGDELPVSKVNMFGQNQTDTAKFEKRNVTDLAPWWNSQKCVECGKCTMVCPHAVIRAKILNSDAQKNAPSTLQSKQCLVNKSTNFTLEVSPKDCLACGLCEKICPTKAITLVHKDDIVVDAQANIINKNTQNTQTDANNLQNAVINTNILKNDSVLHIEEQNYNYTKNIQNIVPNIPLTTLKTQFLKPYFEFSGACAGCGETSYIRLLTQLFGSQLIIANATGCSSIYGGSAPTCPYTKDDFGFGPAWANSLFEDNAEFGLGIEKSQNLKRENFKNYVAQNIDNFSQNLQKTLKNWLNNYKNYDICKQIYINLKNNPITKINSFDCFVADNLDLLTPKAVWLVGGDGWAYDIDFGGLDHVFASGENINILVLDTELYSNTGGQMSKSSPIGSVEKFCADGKKQNKKNLALSALNYKNVYVASICLSADMNQAINAINDAQNYNGVSLIIAYAPCINHGIDMTKSANIQIDAVKCGYWHLFRYNPALASNGKNPLAIDSPAPTTNFKQHLLNERRFVNYVEKTNDTTLFDKFENNNTQFYNYLLNLKQLLEPKNN